MMRYLWGVAEAADWYGVPPRRFWAWLLKHLDKHHGHYLKYD